MTDQMVDWGLNENERSGLVTEHLKAVSDALLKYIERKKRNQFKPPCLCLFDQCMFNTNISLQQFA